MADVTLTLLVPQPSPVQLMRVEQEAALAIGTALRGPGNMFVQDAEPVCPTPYIWFKTADGEVVDILKG